MPIFAPGSAEEAAYARRKALANPRERVSGRRPTPTRRSVPATPLDYVMENNTMPLPAFVGPVAGYAAGAVVQRFLSERGVPPSPRDMARGFTGPTNETYGDPTQGAPRYVDPRTGKYCGPRRRRRQLLTLSDKNDIAFLRGTLGGGELGKAAITALLTRRS